jgi:hypothetical protein
MSIEENILKVINWVYSIVAVPKEQSFSPSSHYSVRTEARERTVSSITFLLNATYLILSRPSH